jgi:hypothetical protein
VSQPGPASASPHTHCGSTWCEATFYPRRADLSPAVFSISMDGMLKLAMDSPISRDRYAALQPLIATICNPCGRALLPVPSAVEFRRIANGRHVH